MEKSTFDVWMPRVLMIAVLGLSVVGASTGEGDVSGVDDDSASQVFGVVVSGDGSALPGVLISLSGGDVKKRTVSATDGAFRFASIAPGDYLMVFHAQGKKKVKRKITISTEDVDLGTIVLD